MKDIKSAGGKAAEIGELVKLEPIVHVSVPVKVHPFRQVNVDEL